MIPVALTIAGSDPSGGAGVQADLKTFSALRVYGMSVITALTAQNTLGVASVFVVPEASIDAQIDAVLGDIVPAAVKTGMLASARIVELVSRKIREARITNVVVDPVMASTSGSKLLDHDARNALHRDLLPLARIVTPNLDEAEALTGRHVVTVADMEEAALQIHRIGAATVYVKGGHLEGDPVDVFFDGKESSRLQSQRIATADTHGTGCVLSAAMAAYLALGESPLAAVRLAKDVVTAAVRNSLRLGRGHGPCDPIGVRQAR